MGKNNTQQLIATFILLTLFAVPSLLDRVVPIINNNNTNITEEKNPFDSLELEAKSVYVFDVENKKPLYSYNENEKLPIASITKMMTAIVATDLIPESTVVTIDKNDIEEEGDSGLFVGEKWRLADIIDFTLTTSSNDGASAIATVAGSLGQNAYGKSSVESKRNFVAKMNEKTKEIGLVDTVFFNETGLDIDEEISGSYSTAKEIALMMAYIIRNKPSIMDATSFDAFSLHSLNNIGHIATNTNDVVDSIPGLIASKTGFTDLAGGNLIVAFDSGLMHPIIISVLGSSREGRFSDMEKLVSATLKAL
jgi:D-alanyl-D-alanine carboxypeptidase (penicillin-binding protein 5/6)